VVAGVVVGAWVVVVVVGGGRTVGVVVVGARVVVVPTLVGPGDAVPVVVVDDGTAVGDVDPVFGDAVVVEPGGADVEVRRPVTVGVGSPVGPKVVVGKHTRSVYKRTSLITAPFVVVCTTMSAAWRSVVDAGSQSRVMLATRDVTASLKKACAPPLLAVQTGCGNVL
jgi:hypothetical protein